MPAKLSARAKPRRSKKEIDDLADSRVRIAELERNISSLREYIEEQNKRLAVATESRIHFFELFHNSPAGYVVHNQSGEILDLNRAAEKLLWLRPRTAVKTSLAWFFSPEDLVLWLGHIRHCISLRQKTITELCIQPKGQRLIPVQIITVPGPFEVGQKPLRFYSVITDLTARRSAERALAQTERDYQRLINTIEGIVWEADAHSLDVTFVSSYATRLLGYPLENWKRAGFWPSLIDFADRERVVSEIARAVAARKDIRLDYHVRTADRRVLCLHDSITVLQRGGQLKLLGVAIDVTEQRRAQEELRQAHDLLEKRVAERTAQLQGTIGDLEAFSYSLSHDMRAPIRAMAGYAELVERVAEDKLGPEVPSYLRRIKSSAERLDLLVQDVLKYSQLAKMSVALHPVPLGPLVDNILHDYPTLAPNKAHIDIQHPLPQVLGHEAFVGQALSNLLTNAVKFMPAGRTPEIKVWSESARQDKNGEVSGARENEENNHWVRVWIQDNGLGIAPQDQARIFRMFERVYPPHLYEGTGMGLAIVQKAIERMGGRIGLESALGSGSRFWIELQRA